MNEESMYSKKRILNAIERTDLKDKQKKLLSELALVADSCYTTETYVSGVFSRIKLHYLISAKPNSGGHHLYSVTITTRVYQSDLYFCKIRLPHGRKMKCCIIETDLDKSLYIAVINNIVNSFSNDRYNKKDLIDWLNYEASRKINEEDTNEPV